jgi:hypothetical protein
VTEQALELEIHESSFSEFDFRLTDPVSGTSLRFDSESPIESIAFAIPLVFVGVSVAAALKWLAVGAAVVVGGVLMVEAAKAVDRILNNRNRKHEHYAAVLRNGRLYVGGGLSRAAALARGRSGGDVWSTSRAQAHAVARAVNTACRPIGPEISRGAGMLYHFHPCRRTPKMHAFFGSPV